MDTKLHLARQSIFDKYGNVVGYEFYYRDEFGSNEILNARQASASVLSNILNQIGSQYAFGDIDPFINIDDSLLLTDILNILPSKQFVFELSSSMQITRQITDVIEYYYNLGYRFALDNASFHPDYISSFAPLIQYVEFVKFDTSQIDIEQFSYQPNPYSQKKLIAQKIEFLEIKEAYEAIGFEFFQGFYLSDVEIITKNKIETKNKEITALFTKLQDESVKEELVDIFKNNNDLMLQFLQYVSSSNITKLKNSNSVLDVLNQYDHKEIANWLLLLIYSKSGSNSTQTKYSNIASNRLDTMYKLLELIDSSYNTQEIKEGIYCVGMLSLLNSVMGASMEFIEDISKDANDISNALLTKNGVLGAILDATLAIEEDDITKAQSILEPYTLAL